MSPVRPICPVRNFVPKDCKIGISNGTYRKERYLKSGMGKRYLKNRLVEV